MMITVQHKIGVAHCQKVANRKKQSNHCICKVVLNQLFLSGMNPMISSRNCTLQWAVLQQGYSDNVHIL